MNKRKTFAYRAILAIVCLCCLLLGTGCSNNADPVTAKLPVYHQDPNQPNPADQAAASMAKRHYGVQNAQTQSPAATSTKP